MNAFRKKGGKTYYKGTVTAVDDEKDEPPFHGISYKRVSKKGYLRKEKAWKTVFWRA